VSPGLDPIVTAAVCLFGSLVPLAALAYAVRRRRVAVIVLALFTALGVNVIFAAYALPSAAATNNSSTFWMSGLNGTTFGCAGASDMYQTAPTTDANGNPYLFSSASSYTYCSDTFAAAQSLNAGAITANFYVANSNSTKDCTLQGDLLWWHAATSTSSTLYSSGTQTVLIPRNHAAAALYTWTWNTSAAAFANGDRLHFTISTFSGVCTSTAYDTQYGASNFASNIVVATIVPEAVAPLALLAPVVPLAMRRWWRRRR
jgi:hypothetical protein